MKERAKLWLRLDKGTRFMKRKSRSREWFAFLVTAGALGLASCAHQGDEDLAQSTSRLADLPGGAVSTTEEYSAGDESVDVDEAIAQEMASNDTGKTEERAAEDQPTEAAPPEQGEESETPFADLSTEAPELAPGPAPELSPPPTAEPEAVALSVPESEPVSLGDSPAPVEITKPARRRVAKASVPSIPKESFEMEGVRLNRFYVLRTGDTAPSVSKMIFGHPNRSAELLSRVGTRSWRPGEILFYNSPDNPEDTTMKSFYEERGVTTEPHTVSAGESLAAVAKARYGSPKSWREIAAVNGLTSTEITVGTTLMLVPVDLHGYSREEWAMNRAVASPAPAEAASPAPIVPAAREDLDDFDPVAEEGGEVVSAPPVPDEFNPRTGVGSRPAPKASFAMSGFFRQNMLLLLIGAAVGLSALFFLVILPNRSRY